MVALKTQQVPGFIAKPDERYRCVLLHGTDPGLVSEYAGVLAKTFSAMQSEPGEIIRLDDRDLAENPDRPVVELRTMAMFGGSKVVRIKAGPRLRADLVEELLRPGANEGFLVVEAGNLKKGIKLRALFETSDCAAAIACYGDDDASLGRMVDEVLRLHELTIAPDAKAALLDLLGADRTLSRGEVEKLALFAHGQSTIDLDDIAAVVGDAAAMSLDDVVIACADGDAAAAFVAFDRALSSGQSVQAVLSAFQRYFAKLHRVRVDCDSGKTLEAAVKSLRPPIHFKQARQFTGQCRAWPLHLLERVIHRVQKVGGQSRLLAPLEHELLGQLIVEVVSLRRRG